MTNDFLEKIDFTKLMIYLMAIGIFFAVSYKLNNLIERLAKLEGKLEIITPRSDRIPYLKKLEEIE